MAHQTLLMLTTIVWAVLVKYKDLNSMYSIEFNKIGSSIIQAANKFNSHKTIII